MHPLRRVISAMALAVAMTLAATACSPPPAYAAPARAVHQTSASTHLVRTARCPAPTFRYDPAEVRCWWNQTHPFHQITGTQAFYVAAFWNRIVLQRIAAYLVAISQPHCAPGAPDECARLIVQMFSAWHLDGYAAVRVGRCESGLNPTATNGSFDGLFQQMRSAWASRSSSAGYGGRSIYDPVANIGVSRAMVAGSGWSAWECRP